MSHDLKEKIIQDPSLSQNLKKKFKNISIDDVCEKGVKVADEVDIMLGGIEWLVKSREAKDLISFFDPAIKDHLNIVVASAAGPLRISENMLSKLDKYIIGPKCKRKSRNSKKQEGVQLMNDLFTNITNNEAYTKVCYVAQTTVDLLSKLVKILNIVANSIVIMAVITSQVGPDAVVKLKELNTSSKKALELLKTIQKTICVFLRAQVKK